MRRVSLKWGTVNRQLIVCCTLYHSYKCYFIDFRKTIIYCSKYDAYYLPTISFFVVLTLPFCDNSRTTLKVLWKMCLGVTSQWFYDKELCFTCTLLQREAEQCRGSSSSSGFKLWYINKTHHCSKWSCTLFPLFLKRWQFGQVFHISSDILNKKHVKLQNFCSYEHNNPILCLSSSKRSVKINRSTEATEYTVKQAFGGNGCTNAAAVYRAGACRNLL